ncbi:relaxase/mobilization nuclease domain-containing protein [Methylosinus sporium]|uniref:relaxase/mobilization nuclease domain-containing protein n=1 Tax=Methylosinus sporium TaxID=428 RepID=UPI000D59ADED|nr:VirD2 family relaxase/mobilization nuclease [Methylosinus sporium]PWB88871.1 type VI secretion protein [Methylocystis sp. MitZ-2018]
MSRDDDIRIRPGRVRSTKPGRAKSFVARVLAATQKAGGLHRGAGGKAGSFGRGRAASLLARRGLTSKSRGVVVKARVVRHGPKSAPLAAHLSYLRRDGVTRDGAPGKMFDAGGDEADARNFAERCDGDRHHFRFIVSPDDAAELSDLRNFTRDLMGQMARDLGTRVDWVAVDHWNTEHPHIHILVRGRADDGRDLVISRDYISRGLRGRGEQLVTLELGPRSELEIRRGLERQVEADRWTPLDQTLARQAAGREGVVDLRPNREPATDSERPLVVGRIRKLEKLGLVAPIGPGQWVLVEEAESTLRALGERGDIIKRIHRGLTERGIERSAGDFAWDGVARGDPILGRLVSRGLDDELKGSAFAVVDGVDGRAHHIRFADLDATGDAAPGAIVEVRRLPSHDGGSSRLVLAVRSDLSIEDQIHAKGATWLDRRLVEAEPVPLSEAGFGREVRSAMDARADHLAAAGLARRQGRRFVFARDLLATLRTRELNDSAERLSAHTGLPRHIVAEGESVAGVYRQRLTLASGRYAMIDDGLGFSLVPWSSSLERELERHVSGIVSPGGVVEWSLGRRRGIGR